MLKKLKKILKKEMKGLGRPFGIFLSGGIDSAILAAMARPDFAVTCNFDEGEKYDELEYAKLVAKSLKIPLTVIRPTREDFESDLGEAVKIIGKPINSVSIVPWYNLMIETQGETMLNGEGADELFGGYSRYLIMKHIFELYDVPELKNYKDTVRLMLGDIHSRLVDKDMPDEINMEAVMRSEYVKTLPDIIYMEKKLAEHFNVNFIQPFMSEEIREFASKLDMKYKIKGWTTKVILRQLAKELGLPGSIYNRVSKSGLVCPVNKWMGWTGEKGEFDKKIYFEYQKEFL